jgi:hypothetical protein
MNSSLCRRPDDSDGQVVGKGLAYSQAQREKEALAHRKSWESR